MVQICKSISVIYHINQIKNKNPIGISMWEKHLTYCCDQVSMCVYIYIYQIIMTYIWNWYNVIDQSQLE